MNELDFWIGRWTCTWEGGHGTNTVTRDLEGHVITERFEALEPEPFSGLSLSVRGPDGVWRQTWVDSTGSYWHFEGGSQDDGTFVFATPGRVDADQVFKRMVFSEISSEGFAWRWEFSEDRAAWEQRWAITYRRAVNGGRVAKTIDLLLDEARARYTRLEAAAAAGELAADAVLVDVRPSELRREHGSIPGALVIGLNVLEWHADPASPWHDPEFANHDVRVILICQEGYSSRLAASRLLDLGLHRATDVIDGVDGWRAAGLPLTADTS